MMMCAAVIKEMLSILVLYFLEVVENLSNLLLIGGDALV